MGLVDLSSPTELQDFLKANGVCVVTFSAHWCGPCRASRPQLEALATKLEPVAFGIVHESDLGDFLHTFSVKAFPTYVCFVQGTEAERVQGVQLAAVETMVQTHGGSANAMPGIGGTALGGSGATAISPAEARALRLAKLDAAPKAQEEGATPMDTEDSTPNKKEEAAADTSMEVADDEAKAGGEEEKPASNNPVDGLDPYAIKTLTGEMGFSLLRAQKGLLFSTAGTVESAVEWLMEHQDDADIDEPIPEGAGAKAQSYKCNECGKVLSNMANLELHANKTGHSDFEESIHTVKPLTVEEKATKMTEIKQLLKAKRAQREEAEKVDHVEREIQRRFMGKEMKKTKEEMEKEQRKRDTLARKREKAEYTKERARIKAELEKDKRERATNNGKLKTALGVDGYNPSAIQYDDGTGADESSPSKPKKAKADAGKIDEYISKVSAYRAGGDGAKCLKILKAYVGNAADNPTEDKFKMINMDNKAYKTKVKPFIGGKRLLLAVGFSPKEGEPTFLELKPDADLEVLKAAKEKLEKAIAAF